MLKKFIKRTENNEVKMSDSALRDIIPSNDVAITKNLKRKRFSSVCKILIFIFILGFITVGILLLALLLTFSGKSFVSFILQPSGANLLPVSNKTQVHTFHRENFTATSDKPDWKKITVIPKINNQKAHTLSSIITTEQETKYISTNTQSRKSYVPSTTRANEQSTSTAIQTTISNHQSTILSSTTMKNQEYIETSLENSMTTANSFTSPILIQKIRDHETTTSKKLSLTTGIDLKFSTNENTKKFISAKQEKLEEENIIDDLLFS